MNSSMRKYPIAPAPRYIQLAVRTIAEDIKVSWFFTGLQKVGIDDVWAEPHLMSIVLELMKFPDVPDHLVEFYLTLLQKYSKRQEKLQTRDLLYGHAYKMYFELRAKKCEMTSK